MWSATAPASTSADAAGSGRSTHSVTADATSPPGGAIEVHTGSERPSAAHVSSGRRSSGARNETIAYAPPAARSRRTVRSSAAAVCSTSAQSSMPLSKTRLYDAAPSEEAAPSSHTSHALQTRPEFGWRARMCATQSSSRSTAVTRAYPALSSAAGGLRRAAANVNWERVVRCAQCRGPPATGAARDPTS